MAQELALVVRGPWRWQQEPRSEYGSSRQSSQAPLMATEVPVHLPLRLEIHRLKAALK